MAVSHIFSNAAGNFTGTVTAFNSQGSTTTVAATNLVRPQDWNSAHNQLYTLTGNTTGNSTASGTNVIFAASRGIHIGGSTGSVVIMGPPLISFFQNIHQGGTNTSGSQSVNGVSISQAVSFQMPQPISAGFLRIPVSMTVGETTRATTAATLSASVQMLGTWNAVIYSAGTGGSSRSLISVASGSTASTVLNSVSVAVNGTQYSITQAWTMPMEGDSTTFSTQYSISNTNLSFTSAQVATLISGGRFIDIPFANSLSAGPYWLIFGHSSSSATNSTGISAMSAVGARYSYHAAVQGHNSFYGIMGSTNLTSGGHLGAGSFSTAGGGTTSILPISAISSSASNMMPVFQIIRSA